MDLSHRIIGDLCIVTVNVENFSDGAVAFKKYLDTFLNDENIKCLLVDMRKMVMIDSSGIGVIVSDHKKMEERKAAFGIFGLNPVVLSVFRMTRLDNILHIYDNEAAARAALSHS